jgi:hypothetical protein
MGGLAPSWRTWYTDLRVMSETRRPEISDG